MLPGSLRELIDANLGRLDASGTRGARGRRAHAEGPAGAVVRTLPRRCRRRGIEHGGAARPGSHRRPQRRHHRLPSSVAAVRSRRATPAVGPTAAPPTLRRPRCTHRGARVPSRSIDRGNGCGRGGGARCCGRFHSPRRTLGGSADTRRARPGTHGSVGQRLDSYDERCKQPSSLSSAGEPERGLELVVPLIAAVDLEGDEPADAPDLLIVAGRAHSAVYGASTALPWLERAAALLPEGSPERARLLGRIVSAMLYVDVDQARARCLEFVSAAALGGDPILEQIAHATHRVTQALGGLPVSPSSEPADSAVDFDVLNDWLEVAVWTDDHVRADDLLVEAIASDHRATFGHRRTQPHDASRRPAKSAGSLRRGSGSR